MPPDSSAHVEVFAEQVRLASSTHRPLLIRGGGTKDFYGQHLEGDVLDTRGHAGIVEYAPSELVLTARAGTLLVDIESALAAQRQYLPFEPPHYGPGTTLGGMVAAGLAGPGRLASGGVRDYVLGAQILDGRAQVLRFGGQVMKNVAGYDVTRALAGSLGTLGLILEVSLKVLPVKTAGLSLQFACTAAEALERTQRWAARALPMTANAWSDAVLTVRLGGSAGAVQAAAREMGGTALDDADAARYWTAMRDQTAGFFAGPGPLWRIALPHGTPMLELDGPVCLEWSGMQRWLRSAADPATIRAMAAAAGGHATLFRATPEAKGTTSVFTPRTGAVAAIERNLKLAFDPEHIFNRGRLDAT